MKKILLTSADQKFFPHAQALLESVLSKSGDIVEQAVLFDLGMQSAQREMLAAMPGVTVADYPSWLTTELYPDYLTPRMFAWKTFLLQAGPQFGDLILYADAGVVALQNLQPIYEIIAAEDGFFVQDCHRTSARTHQACLDILGATEAERNALQIDAGVIGYRAGGAYQKIFDEAFGYSQNRACIFGDARTHRHDQSLYSILAVRHGVKKFYPYGELCDWQGINSPGQILWQHRGAYLPLKRLPDRLGVLPTEARVVLYGAGRHTSRFLKTLQYLLEPRVKIVGILDDSPSVSKIAGLSVVRTADYRRLEPTAILVSSVAHEAAMAERVRPMLPAEIPVFTIYA